MPTNNFTEYTDETARLSILKAKAALTCKIHPDVLISLKNLDAEKRAFAIAENTLKYNDRGFLLETVTLAVKTMLDMADVSCRQCSPKMVV